LAVNQDPAAAIPRELLLAVYAHARATYPEECCGFLVGGAAGPPEELRRVDNRQNDLHQSDPERFPRDARTAYNMGARDLLWLQKSLSGARPVRVIYHSHCDVRAYFSDEDKRAATWDGEPLYPVDYLVIDAKRDRVDGAKLFRFDQAQRDFCEIASFPGEP
jgi:adenylyltransferase/sulfurtransferase